MVWIFLSLGIGLLVLGVLVAVLPTLLADHSARHVEGGEGEKGAWEILSQPLYTEELIRIPKDQPLLARLGHNRFLQGSIVGAGAGLILGGVILSYGLVPSATGTALAAEKSGAPTQSAQTAGGNAGQTAGSSKPASSDAEKVAGETKSPAEKDGAAKPMTFEVQPGEASQAVAARLKQAGLIKEEEAFLNRLKERGLETMIKAGAYEIPAGASVDQVIDLLTK
jgi:hypothetical protein